MPDPGPGLRRFAIGAEYDGTAYHGWQIQPHAPSVQEKLNLALSRVADEAIECVGAGRTDTGVHAAAQVLHFDTTAERSPRAWVLGLNSNLPDDINALWAAPVPADFHARYSAVSRTYGYRILNRPVRSALERHRAWWLRQPLDYEAMRMAAGHFLGEHDFSAFRAAACQSRTPVRDVTRLAIEREDSLVRIEITANAFLHHMVRNIVGTLVWIGRGEAGPDWVLELLAGRDRKLAGMTAPAAGLTLTAVDYPARLGLPSVAIA